MAEDDGDGKTLKEEVNEKKMKAYGLLAACVVLGLASIFFLFTAFSGKKVKTKKAGMGAVSLIGAVVCGYFGASNYDKYKKVNKLFGGDE